MVKRSLLFGEGEEFIFLYAVVEALTDRVGQSISNFLDLFV